MTGPSASAGPKWEFTYAGLRRFLSHLKATAPMSTFSDWDGANVVLLRHDVDADPVRAVPVARLEAELGVPATFFFMVSNPAYNVMSAVHRDAIAAIAGMGFEIGLHFDPSAYPDTGASPVRARADAEAAVLATIGGRPVRSISIHNPSVHGRFDSIEGYRNAYDPRIFAPDRYASDSRMILRHDLYEFSQRVREHPVQILLHPFHFTDAGDEYSSLACGLALDVLRRVDGAFRVNGAWAEAVKPDLVEHLRRRLGEGKAP
ncbi:MAG TPA: hypothetical protein VM681_04760 [Candidatus Thermoplasmatota archaeon]|nr:hypothetical protein [Candidatus Thermoplasmatota archaeon]